MLTLVTLDDKDGNPVVLHDVSASSKRGAVEAHGLIGGVISALRADKSVRPQARGGINNTRYEDAGAPYFTLEIVGDDIDDAFEEWREISAVLKQTLRYGPTLLKWTEGESGLELQRLVKVDSMVDPPLAGAAAILTFPVTFCCEDPRAYSQTLDTETSGALSDLGGGMVMPFTFPFTFAQSGGGTVTVTNTGSDDAPFVARIHGEILNPQIVNLDTQERIKLGTDAMPAEVGEGLYLELDSYNRTILLEDGSDQYGMLDSSASTWFELPPGDTNLQLVGASFDGAAHLEVDIRAAF